MTCSIGPDIEPSRSQARTPPRVAGAAWAIAACVLLATRSHGAGVVPASDAVNAPGAPSMPTAPQAEVIPAPVVSDVDVIAATPLTESERAGDGLYQFIVHHATVHYVNNGTAGNLARWRGGSQSLCPRTVGLSPAYNAFVTARLRAVATYVGAPVQADPQCKDNVRIIFTDNPQERMEDVRRWAKVYFRNRYSGGMGDLIKYRGDHPIQGWYMTTRGGAIVLNTDVSLVGLDVLPIWPQITPSYITGPGLGTRGGPGSGSGIGVVVLVIDTRQIVGDTIGSIADYLAVLTLSVAQSPDHCDPMPSILDLMAPSCGSRSRPAGITAGDVAFLKALYYRDSGLGPSLSRAAIQDNMVRQFKIG